MSDPTPDPSTSLAERAEGEPNAAVLPGAEPLSVEGSSVGVLVIHGFTGSPQSMRGLAEAFAAAGFTVEMPRLPGHGISLDAMLITSWDDWSSAVETAYNDLAERCESVVVAGLSMGGTLTLWLASRHPEIAGIVLINAAAPPPGSSSEMIEGLKALAESGTLTIDAIGSDIAKEGVVELAYEQTPVEPLISMLTNAEAVAGDLGSITCPVLIMTSPQDHVVEPTQSDHIASSVAGPVERLTLERSYHVATLDYDRELIEEQAVAFAKRVTS